MAKTNVGTAYVQIIPSADGISSGIKSALTGSEMGAIGKQSGTVLAGGLKKALVAGAIAAAVVTVGKAAASYANECIEYYNVQERAETKLATVMQQRMGATQSQINGIKDYASALQQAGVVGDEVQLAGAGQLATFLKTDDALKSLMPAMNNLATSQYGVSVSGEQMTGIANMVGKAMQGQVGALTRAGITMSEEEKKLIQFGTEEERAAALSKIITNNVGEMNAAMLNTPEGKMQQAANAMGDLKEQVGKAVVPIKAALISGFASFVTKIAPTLITWLNRLVELFGNLYKGALPGLKNTLSFVASGWRQFSDSLQPVKNALQPVFNYLSKGNTQLRIGSVLGHAMTTTWRGLGVVLRIIARVINTVVAAFKKVKAAVDTVKNLINKIRSLKTLLSGSIGKLQLKVPKISISGGKAPWGIGGLGTKPKFSVKWNAHGGIVNRAQLIGAGEAGSEAILPLDPFWKKMDEIAGSISNGASGVMNVVINLDGQTIGQSTVNYINGQTLQFNASPLMV